MSFIFVLHLVEYPRKILLSPTQHASESFLSSVRNRKSNTNQTNYNSCYWLSSTVYFIICYVTIIIIISHILSHLILTAYLRGSYYYWNPKLRELSHLLRDTGLSRGRSNAFPQPVWLQSLCYQPPYVMRRDQEKANFFTYVCKKGWLERQTAGEKQIVNPAF